ncbi:MAG: TM1812 family CRISPR-associated protein [Oscillospiraceae bacterium]|nr:TM1812 family CRISPR-associated protein [Oscillospiraceae bacterium]MDY3257832.1 TM1812 family CRISPR-associated protein [Ruminococcus callidus]
MKKFIMVSPFQPVDSMKKGHIYTPENNPDLNYTETSFPIIPVINAYAEKDEEIEIIAVVSEYKNAEDNFELFKNEIEKLSKEKGFVCDEIKKVSVPYSDDLDSQLEMFGKLIDYTSDNDMLYADITYGSKVMTQILTMAVNYGYRIHKNVALGCIVYGKFDHMLQKASIYDVTSLNYMDEIVRVMAENKISNPTEKIKKLLK